MKFKTGDKVRLTVEFETLGEGSEGVVVETYVGTGYSYPYKVKFSEGCKYLMLECELEKVIPPLQQIRYKEYSEAEWENTVGE